MALLTGLLAADLALALGDQMTDDQAYNEYLYYTMKYGDRLPYYYPSYFQPGGPWYNYYANPQYYNYGYRRPNYLYGRHGDHEHDHSHRDYSSVRSPSPTRYSSSSVRSPSPTRYSSSSVRSPSPTRYSSSSSRR
jgi:hypothetical protein